VPQTQSSIAVSSDGARWVLLNASPDLRQQIQACPALHPREGPRHSPIAAVVLTNADVDHVAGLLTLRERGRFGLFATPGVHAVLERSRIFDVLQADCVRRCELKLEEAARIERLDVRLFAVPGKVPLYLEPTDAECDAEALSEDTVAVEVSDPSGPARLSYIPGCSRITPELRARLRGAPLVLFDGTLFRDDELIVQGLGRKTGSRMGHVPMSGPGGSLAQFADLGVARRLFVHINNSNPVWLADSAERAAIRAAGWELARDGMELEL
jgi:pyrroloquinoline quinone biosynthesis protein B